MAPAISSAIYANSENRLAMCGVCRVKGSASGGVIGYAEIDNTASRIYTRMEAQQNDSRVSNSNPFAFDEDDAWELAGWYFTDDA